MASSLNKVTLIGHLGRDPETRYMPSGDAITNISLATTESWKDKASGEKKEATEWHRISAFGKLAEIIGQYLHKGSKVYVEGSLRTRSYEKDGQTHYSTEIRADQLIMLDGKPAGEGGGQQQRQVPAGGQQRPASAPAQRPAPNFNDMDDDIPF